MKKLLTILLALTFVFALSCKKEEPNKELYVPTPIETAREYINNGEFEKAHTLLLTLEGDERDELLSHFRFAYSRHSTLLADGTTYEGLYEYDSHGNLIKYSNNDGSFSEYYEYDERDRRTKGLDTTKNGDRYLTTWSYDEEDRVIEKALFENDTLKWRETIVYDEKGNRTSSHVEHGDGYTTNQTATYNENGDVLTTYYESSDDIREANLYEYDEENRLLKHTFNSRYNTVSVDEYVYDENGYTVTMTEEGRLLQKSFYDKNGNEILSEYSPYSSTEFATKETEYTEDGVVKRITYTYKDDPEKTSRKNYTFDENGRVIKVEETFSNGDIYMELTTYHENGERASVENRHNGERLVLQLFREDGLIERSITNSYDYTYEYDEYGNLLKITDALSEYSEEYTGYKLYYHPTNFENEEIY